MKIYVVTDGCYSDYHIVAAFTDKDLADVLAKKISAEVEEYESDNMDIEAIRNGDLYFVRMDNEGKVLNLDKEDSSYGVGVNEKIGKDINGNNFMYIWAKDEDHAIKIARDRIHNF